VLVSLACPCLSLYATCISHNWHTHVVLAPAMLCRAVPCHAVLCCAVCSVWRLDSGSYPDLAQLLYDTWTNRNEARAAAGLSPLPPLTLLHSNISTLDDIREVGGWVGGCVCRGSGGGGGWGGTARIRPAWGGGARGWTCVWGWGWGMRRQKLSKECVCCRAAAAALKHQLTG